MKDVDYFQTLEVRVSTTMQDIKYLYLLLCEAQRTGSPVRMDYTNSRLIVEFEEALEQIPDIVLSSIKHTCHDILDRGAKLKIEPYEDEYKP